MPNLTASEQKQAKDHLLRIKTLVAESMEGDGRELTEAEEAECTELLAKVNGIKSAAIKRAGLSKAMSELGELMTEGGADVTDSGLVVPGAKARKVRESAGKQMVNSDAYKDLLSRAPASGFNEKTPIGHMDTIPYDRKTLVTSAGGFTYDSPASAGAFVDVQHLGLTQDALTYQRPLVVAQLFSHGTTSTDTIDYVVTNSVTNNAAPVAEATTDAAPTTGASSGAALVYPAGSGLKPNSAVSFERHKTSVKTIAHGLTITKRALSDAEQVMSFIDNFLEYGLNEEVEDQLLTGDGTGENLLGLAHVSGTLAQAKAPISPISEDARILATYRKAKTNIRLNAHVVPTGYLMNPVDAEQLDLAAMNTGQYLNGSPFTGGQGRTLWGLPVIESEAVAAGTPWCAAWNRGVIFDRQQSTMTMTDSHADFFMRNLVQILAELRLAFVVLNPAAFCKITLPVDNTTA